MKEIRTNQYKESQGYPPGVTEQDISYPDPQYQINERGTEIFEIIRDWDEYRDWFSGGGDLVLEAPFGKKPINVTAEYSVLGYDRNNPKEWNVQFQVMNITDDIGNDVTKYDLHDFENDSLREAIREMILNS